MTQTTSHISVCICTYKRPDRLATLLNALLDQHSDGTFTFSVVVVDNDRMRSAEKTVEDLIRYSSIPITYRIEPEQNIALARNRAVVNAQGEFVAFLDDDEVPSRSWLSKLYKACHEFRADG